MTRPSRAGSAARSSLDNFLFGQARRRALAATTRSSKGASSIPRACWSWWCSSRRRYGIKVEDEELVPDNLDSIDRLRRSFVERQAAG